MTKGEVAGLQSLALAHGGSLTINPHTGLVEAGFLSSFLPMLVGAGLSIASGGALTPLMAAGIMGGGTALVTGSLRKGLMAGLGAYGGAGLAGGLSSVGAGLEAGAGAAPAASVAPAAGTIGTGAEAGAGAARSALDAGMGAMPTGTIGAGAARSALDAGMGAMPTGTIGTEALTTPSFADKFSNNLSTMGRGASNLVEPGGFDSFKNAVGGYGKMAQYGLAAAAPVMANGLAPAAVGPLATNSPGMIRPYTYNSVQNTPENPIGASYTPGQSTQERNYMTNTYTAGPPYAAPGPEYKMAEGGVASLDKYSYNPDTQTYSGSSTPSSSSSAAPTGNFLTDAINNAVNTSNQNSIDANAYTYDPVKQRYSKVAPDPAKAVAASGPNSADSLAKLAAANAAAEEMVRGVSGSGFANGGSVPMRFASGGSNLGGYSDGGQLLRGPGDGVSDSIPAMIGQKQHARLADGEFVVPARIVSELGNGSTEAGARQLYAMMDRVQNARTKAMGKDKVATNTRAAKLLPA
jgi:hypothetical protein